MENQRIEPSSLPFCIDEERFGTLHVATIECPGVYYISTDKNEYYVALKSTTECILSQDALKYGIDCDELQIFSLGNDRGGAKIVEYEIKRYKERCGEHLQPFESTLGTAIYAAEYYPEYFGSWYPPHYTPNGVTTRHLKIDEGIFFLETDLGVTLLAVVYPIWNAELSPFVQTKGEQIEYEKKHELHTLGYLFFKFDLTAIVFYDLILGGARNSLLKYIKSENSFFSSIWKHCPEYALHINVAEQSGFGHGNTLYNLLRALGSDIPELQKEPCNFIPFIENSNTDFLALPDSWLR